MKQSFEVVRVQFGIYSNCKWTLLLVKSIKNMKFGQRKSGYFA